MLLLLEPFPGKQSNQNSQNHSLNHHEESESHYNERERRGMWIRETAFNDRRRLGKEREMHDGRQARMGKL